MKAAGDFERFRSRLSDRYSIGEEIGYGGMAAVYRAHDVRHDREVAIKVLNPSVGVTLGADRFLREIAIDARLQHPNILPLFDSGQIDEFLYFVMPLADGGSLQDRLAAERPLAVDESLRIVREVADALGYAHRTGIVHRDVKPANILFCAGHAMVADFGIARAIANVGRDRLTTSGVTVGTPMYMSPEQAAGDTAVDARSDVYSLACVLFEMLAGDPPFTGANARVVLSRQLTERPPSVEVARPDVPEPVASALTRALAKVPADRPPSVQAFIDSFDQPTLRPNMGRIRSRPLVKAAAAIALTAIAGAALSRAAQSADDLSPNKVAVFPLATRGVSGASLDGAGVAYLIEVALEQADPLRLVDVTNRLNERQLADPLLVASSDASNIAGSVGAAFYLRGVVQGHGDSTTVILALHDVRGDSLIAQQSATGATGSAPLHHLGIDALVGLLPALLDPTTRIDLDPLRARKASAVALWWQGERAYRNATFRNALALYERALAEDSALIIAAVKGAQAASWTHDTGRGGALVDIALARDSLLPLRYVLLARGLQNYFVGAADSAIHWFNEAIERYPDWWEPSVALGEVYYHMLPVTAAPLDSLAHAAFARGLEADSSSPALYHLIEIQLRNGEARTADRLLERFRRADPEPQLLRIVTLMRECVGNPPAMPWGRHAQTHPVEVMMAGQSLSVAGLQRDCAEGAYRATLTSSAAGPSEHWGAFLGLQGLLIATGRDPLARALIDSVVVSGKGAARSLYVLGTVAGANMEEPAAQLESFARERYGPTYEGVARAESRWVLSVWLQHIGDREGLARINRLLEMRAASDSATQTDQFFARAAQARAMLNQDTTRAIALLSALPTQLPAMLSWGFEYALPPERLLLARLLLAQGRYRESMTAASVFDHPQPIMFLPYLPGSLEIRYQAALALGDQRAAERFRVRLQRLNRLDLVAD